MELRCISLEVVCRHHFIIRAQLPQELLEFYPFDVDCPYCGADLGQPVVLGRALSFVPFQQDLGGYKAWSSDDRSWEKGVKAIRKYFDMQRFLKGLPPLGA